MRSSEKKHWDKGELRPFFKSVFLPVFLLLDSENYQKRYSGAFRGVENWKSVTFWRVLFIRSQSVVDVVSMLFFRRSQTSLEPLFSGTSDFESRDNAVATRRRLS